MQWWCSATGEAWSWQWQAYPGVWLFALTTAALYALAVRRSHGAQRGGYPLERCTDSALRTEGAGQRPDRERNAERLADGEKEVHAARGRLPSAPPATDGTMLMTSPSFNLVASRSR